MATYMPLLQLIGALVVFLLLGCSTPQSVRELQELDAAGELFYEEHRHHECGSHIGGFMCVHSCASLVWRYWRAQGDFELNVNALQSKLVDLGFDPVPIPYGERSRSLWTFFYDGPNEVDARITAGTQPWRQGLVVVEAPRDEPVVGEYVYGVGASYQTTWDWIVESWRNSAFMFVFGTCDGNDPIGSVYPPR